MSIVTCHLTETVFIISFYKGSGVVTRRPLILQLVHTPHKTKTTASKKSTKEVKPKVVEDEDGDSCEYKSFLCQSNS